MALMEEMESQGNYLFKYRSYLPLALLVIGWLVFVLETYRYLGDDTQAEYFDLAKPIALGVCLLGLFIRMYTVGYAARNTSGRNTEGQLAESLNTTGMYSIVRHPLYVGNFFMWLGFVVLTANLYFIVAFTLTYWLYYERIMFAEEQFLRRKFKDEYVNWSLNVGAFVPTFKSWIKPVLGFNWKRVIKKEKNGLLAIFVLFLLFELTGRYIEGIDFIVGNWYLYATLTSAIIYLVIKIFRSSTSLLKEIN